MLAAILFIITKGYFTLLSCAVRIIGTEYELYSGHDNLNRQGILVLHPISVIRLTSDNSSFSFELRAGYSIASPMRSWLTGVASFGAAWGSALLSSAAVCAEALERRSKGTGCAA